MDGDKTLMRSTDEKLITGISIEKCVVADDDGDDDEDNDYFEWLIFNHS